MQIQPMQLLFFGEKEGELLSFLRAELDVAIAYAFEGNWQN